MAINNMTSQQPVPDTVSSTNLNMNELFNKYWWVLLIIVAALLYYYFYHHKKHDDNDDKESKH